MTKEIDSCLEKIIKRIATLEAKDEGLKKFCREKWDVNWYGTLRWQEEYEKRHAKCQSELKTLNFYKKAIYDIYLTAIEKGLEEGTKTERIYLGLEEADYESAESVG